MDFRSTSCVFLGYSTSHYGYRCLDSSFDRLYIARHVLFNEQSFPHQQPSSDNTQAPSPNPYISLNPTHLLFPTPSLAIHIPTSPSPTEPSPPVTPPPASTETNTASSPSLQTYSRRPKPTAPSASSSDQPSFTAPPSPPTSTNVPPPPRTRPANLRPNTKQTTKPHHTSFHTITTSSILEPTTITIPNKDPLWCKAMTKEYSALLKNNT
ncbi:hypothetical protein L1987_83933 [Smallanthus sonchifolius]|uniref:Uncharacterized protein n=1 Tax=Smallanthus sonchifolius TaxID=185202 RepID=A0ACB8YDC2_9ASTR|nr:hypothetical protein L1987_83933 [Smallanthus sonchifolius]